MFPFPTFPEAASSIASSIDLLYLFLVGISLLMSALIFLCIFYFAIKYRRGSRADRSGIRHHSLAIELVWSGIPLLSFLVMFFWGAWLFYDAYTPPDDALQIYVVGKQWMWKIQHPEGRREINQLHVPVDQSVKLTLTSEDVIHDFFIPAFRVKKDVLPSRYTSLWFRATKTGSYHLFCAQYCGTNHSAMIGQVVVMEPAEYQMWLAGGPPAESMAQAGAKLFERYNCNTCHVGGGRGPLLADLFGSTVQLENGQIVVVDEAYVRESILLSAAKVVAGYQPIMPAFQGQISETGVLQLIAYIQSLGGDSDSAQP